MPKNNLTEAPYIANSQGGLYLLAKTHGDSTTMPATRFGVPIRWLPNTSFAATMEFVTGSMFTVRDTVTGNEYPMFPSEVSKCIELDVIRGKRITGNWEIVKRNTAYAIQLV